MIAVAVFLMQSSFFRNKTVGLYALDGFGMRF